MINRVVLVGRLTQDPVARKSQSGTTFVNFTIAVNRRFAGPNQEQQTDFINCVVFGKPAEFMEQYIKKGYLIGVEGRIQTRNYENQQGQRVYVTEVICDAVQNYQPRNSAPSTFDGGSRASDVSHEDSFSSSDFANTLDISSDDLPF